MPRTGFDSSVAKSAPLGSGGEVSSARVASRAKKPDTEERRRIQAFRQASQHLTKPLPRKSWLEAARYGLRTTTPGAIGTALLARVQGFSPDELSRALEKEKSLLLVYSLGHGSYAVPTKEAALFTRGLFPSDDAALEHLLALALQKTKLPARKLFDSVLREVPRALSRGPLSKNDLHAVLKKALPKSFLMWCAPCNSHHLSPIALRTAGFSGTFCFVPRHGTESYFVRTDRWLGAPFEGSDGTSDDEHHASLARRHFHGYAPSSARELAKWSGISPTEARRAFEAIEDELGEARSGEAFVLKKDRALYESPPEPSGVRLLPPYDPYLMQADRDRLLPDKALQKRVWRTLSNPGVVLVDGEIAAVWKAEKKGKRLLVRFEPFAKLSSKTRSAIAEASEALAPFRDSASTEPTFIA